MWGAISVVSGPSWAAFQHDDRHQPSGGDGGQSFVGPRPLERSRLRFNATPVNTLAYPTETGAVQTMQGLLQLERVLVLFERDGDAEKRDLVC